MVDLFNQVVHEEVGGVVSLAIDEIDPSAQPWMPRIVDDADLDLLASTMTGEEGEVDQAIIVRAADGPYRYEVVTGLRRLHAARKAGHSSVPARIVQANDTQARAIAIRENVARRGLTILEIGRALDALLQERGGAQQDLAPLVGMRPSSISEALTIARGIRSEEIARAAGVSPRSPEAKRAVAEIAILSRRTLMPLAKVADPERRGRALAAGLAALRAGEAPAVAARHIRKALAEEPSDAHEDEARASRFGRWIARSLRWTASALTRMASRLEQLANSPRLQQWLVSSPGEFQRGNEGAKGRGGTA